MAPVALAMAAIAPSTGPVALAMVAIAPAMVPVGLARMAIAPAIMGLLGAETAKTLAFMEKAWLVLLNAVFMLAAFKHGSRQSLKSEISS